MTNNIFERIQKDINENDVIVFMKGSAEMPKCGFSGVVCKILNILNVKYKTVDVLEDEEIRQGIKDFSNWPTIPQVYIKGEFIGGCDITREMYESGELKEMLESKGVI